MNEAPPPGLVLTLQRATHHVIAALDAQARRMGLTPVEMNVIANLSMGRLMTAGELANASGLRPSTLTGVLDRLETAGLLERAPHLRDRRAIAVALTKDGRAKARRVARTITGFEDRVAQIVPDSAMRGFFEVGRAIGSVQRTPAGPTDDDV